MSHMGARLVATANEIAAVTDVVSQVPHKVSFVSGSKTASFSTRPSVRVGARVGVRARLRVTVRAKARDRVRVTETAL